MFIVMVTVLSTAVHRQDRSLIMDESLERAETVIRTLDALISDSSQSAMLQPYILEQLRMQPDIESMLIYEASEDGKVIAAKEQSMLGTPIPPEVLNAAKADEQIQNFKSKELELIAPIHIGETSAYVIQVLFSLEKEFKSANDLLADTILIGVVVLVIFGILLFFLVKWLVSKPIRQVMGVAHEISEGNLLADIPANHRKDEIGMLFQSFTKMTDSLRYLIGNVRFGTAQVSLAVNRLVESAETTETAALEISTNVKELSAGSDMQLGLAQDNAEAMEEMASGVLRIADSSLRVADTSQETSQLANKGDESLQQNVEQMKRIEQTVQMLNNALHSLTGKTEKIEEMVKLINEISAQTNLLALNAAIEAARAGDAGRGFGVVADEIRKLAEQTENSTHEISELVQSIRDDSVSSLTSMEAVNSEVVDGIRQTEEAGVIFKHILGKIEEVTAHIQEVSSASQQISAGTEETAAAISETSRIARAASEKAHVSSDNVTEQLNQINEIKKLSDQVKLLMSNLRETESAFKI
ncbi:methyl-accepting chemotaxis protein [Paenibacillus physcomitrellae]|nr:methyl-accepting chemotaxis protein [Paenibacillus physcomitrellae]